MPRNDNLRFSEPVPVLRMAGEVQDEKGNRFGVLVTGPEKSVGIYLRELPLTLQAHEIPPERPETVELSRPESTLNVEIQPLEIHLPKPYVIHFSIDKDIGQSETQTCGTFTDIGAADLTFSVSQGRTKFTLYEYKEAKKMARRSRTLQVNTIWDVSLSSLYDGYWRIEAIGLDATNEYAVTGDLIVT